MSPDKIVHIQRSFAKIKIPAKAKDVFVFLRSLANAEMRCWAKNSTVMAGTDITHERSLRRNLATLQQAGLISITRQFNQKRGLQSPNQYQILAAANPDKIVRACNPDKIVPPYKVLNAVPKRKIKSVRGQTAHASFLSGSDSKSTPATETQSTPEKFGFTAPPTPPPQPASPGVEVLLDHWRAVFQAKRGVPAHIYAKVRWILRDLLDSQGLPGAMAAVDLWFERSYKVGWETLDTKWGRAAGDAGYAIEDFESKVTIIIQDRRFAAYKAKHDVISSVDVGQPAPSIAAKATTMPANAPSLAERP